MYTQQCAVISIDSIFNISQGYIRLAVNIEGIRRYKMTENIGVIVMSEKRSTKNLKINHRVVSRLALQRKLLANTGGNIAMRKAAKQLEFGSQIIILHPNYNTVSFIDKGETKVEVVKHENLDVYYAILDAVNESFKSDTLLSKYKWERELEQIDKLKTQKLDEDTIGIYECEMYTKYKNNKGTPTGIGVKTTELQKKIEDLKGNVTITLMLILVDIDKIKKILLWGDANIIGVVYKDGINYTLELNKKTYNKITDLLLY